MSLGLKAGKAPIEQRKNNIDMAAWSPIGNALKVPDALYKYAKEKGIEFRWLSRNKITRNSGSHDAGWRVFTLPDGVNMGIENFHFGTPDRKELTRGSMILGYKPKEAAEYHRDILKEKALRMRGVPAQKAEGLRQLSKDAKLNLNVSEGYDDGLGYREVLKDGK